MPPRAARNRQDRSQSREPSHQHNHFRQSSIERQQQNSSSCSFTTTLLFIGIVVIFIFYFFVLGSSTTPPRQLSKELLTLIEKSNDGNTHARKLASQRYKSNYDSLSKKEKLAADIVEQFNMPLDEHPKYGHPRIPVRVLLRGFKGSSSSSVFTSSSPLKKFINNDLLPYLSCFESMNENKNDKQKCVHYISGSEKTNQNHFAKAVNPPKVINENGCYCRIIVIDELADSSVSFNDQYKHFFEGGWIPIDEGMNNNGGQDYDHLRSTTRNDRVLFFAVTKHTGDEIGKIIHGRSTQMFNLKYDVSNGYDF